MVLQEGIRSHKCTGAERSEVGDPDAQPCCGPVEFRSSVGRMSKLLDALTPEAEWSWEALREYMMGLGLTQLCPFAFLFQPQCPFLLKGDDDVPSVSTCAVLRVGLTHDRLQRGRE